MTLTVRSEQSIPGLQAVCHQAAIDAFTPWTQALGAQIAPSVITSAVKAVAGVTDVSLAGFVFTDLAAHQFAQLFELAVNVVVVADV